MKIECVFDGMEYPRSFELNETKIYRESPRLINNVVICGKMW